MLIKLIKDAINNKRTIKKLEKKDEELRERTEDLIKQYEEDTKSFERVLSQNSPIYRGLLKNGQIKEGDIVTIETSE